MGVNSAYIAAFQSAFPVFRQTDPLLIARTLERAQRWVAPAVWGTKVDDGVYLLAADWLLRDPLGGNTELVRKDGTTEYGEQFKEMRLAVAGGFAGVIGADPCGCCGSDGWEPWP